MKRFAHFDFNHKPILTTIKESADHSYRGFFHYHQGIELLFIHEGSGTITVNQKSYQIAPNSLYIFQPFQLHQITIHEPKSYIRTIFHFEPMYLDEKLNGFIQLKDFFEGLWKGKLIEHCFTELEFFKGINENIDQAKKWLTLNNNEDKEIEESFLLVIQLLNGLRNTFTENELDIMSSIHRTRPHVEKMIEWIEEHYHEDFKLQHMSDDLHLSKYYVSHLFKEHTGHAITDYIMARRLKEATFLLVNTDLPIEQVGQAIGVPDASYFTKFFKKRMNVTPKKYRETVTSTFEKHQLF